jgi:hypothetical protein
VASIGPGRFAPVGLNRVSSCHPDFFKSVMQVFLIGTTPLQCFSERSVNLPLPIGHSTLLIAELIWASRFVHLALDAKDPRLIK